MVTYAMRQFSYSVRTYVHTTSILRQANAMLAAYTYTRADYNRL